MTNFEVNRQITKLKSIIRKIDEIHDCDIELLSHWGKYICILASGLLENSIKLIYSDFVRNCSPEPVAKYCIQHLNRIKNPKAEVFLSVARMFKNEWEEALSDFLNTNGQKDAIDSIISNRHLIAHGKDSGITFHSIKIYLAKAIAVLEFIERQCSA